MPLTPSKFYRLISACSLGLCLSACTIIAPTKGSDNIQIADDTQVTDCELIANANTQVLDQVLFVNRSEAAISENLDTLAKNQAVKLGGNTIVASGEISAGARNYQIYNCQR